MYNVLEKVKAGEENEAKAKAEAKPVLSAVEGAEAKQEKDSQPSPQPQPLSSKEKQIYEQGLVGILKQLHEELDEAVFAAYGWPAGLSDEDILEKLVALNAERAAEEAQGQVRWLRPEYQAPEEVVVVTQASLLEAEPALSAVEGAKVKSLEKQPWPKSMAEQAQAVRAALVALDGPVTSKQVAKAFKGARAARVTELLETLASLGQARLVEGERFVAQ
ncbi:MAG: hypothetical protein KDJ65_14210 [Anaerolineae bacterium]|nr:hypothetical protein [Anaerolineae bacterium]